MSDAPPADALDRNTCSMTSAMGPGSEPPDEFEDSVLESSADDADDDEE